VTLSTSAEIAPAVVRAIESAEVGSVASLFEKVLADLPYYNERAKAGELAKFSPSHLQDTLARDREGVLTAVLNGQLVGFCFSNEDDGTIWLSWFGVDPIHRRKGIATAILSTLETRARKLHAHKIWCDSRPDNEPSKSILSHRGFLQLCTIQDHWYRQDFTLWEKAID